MMFAMEHHNNTAFLWDEASASVVSWSSSRSSECCVKSILMNVFYGSVLSRNLGLKMLPWRPPQYGKYGVVSMSVRYASMDERGSEGL
jgi:hypothetical protein